MGQEPELSLVSTFMNALYQALKALDPHTFERLIVHLLKARYPGVDIKHIEGAAGDEGIDVISGQLDEHPTIWQCKSFPNGIKDSQKQQIRKSLNQALKHYTPKRWVLCLSIDMDPAALRWFQKLIKSRAAATQVELWQASDIVQQLLYQHTICEHYFPVTILNTTTIREELAGINAFTTEELAALNDQNVNSYLTRLQAHDARFTYGVTFIRDGQAALGVSPGALVSLTKDSTVLQVFPRDHEALKMRPPQCTFTVRGAGIDKFMEHYRTGSRQTFTAEEVTSFTSDFDFLLPAERAAMSLTVTPVVSHETIPLRITYGKGEQAVTYDYVTFRQARSGKEETLFESVTNLPFPISLIIRANGTGNVGFADRCKGHTVKDAHRQARAIMIAIATGGVEFYDLAHDKRFLQVTLHGTTPEWLQQYGNFLDDAVTVVDAYNVTLTIPDVITKEDRQTLAFLHKLLISVTLPSSEMTVELVKSPEANLEALPEFIGDCTFRFSIPEFPDDITLFGTKIKTGPVQYDIPKARMRDPQAFTQFLKDAPMGAAINATFDPIGLITLRRLITSSEPTINAGHSTSINAEH